MTSGLMVWGQVNIIKNSSAHGEVDFAIVNRSGDVLIIEQKDGPLEETAQGLIKHYRNGGKALNSQIERNTWNLKDTFRQRADDSRELVIDHLIYCPDHRIVKIDAPGIDKSRTVDAASNDKLAERITELLSPGMDPGDNWAGWMSGATSGRNEALSGSSVGRGILTPYSRWR